jgi:hypothetical protein
LGANAKLYRQGFAIRSLDWRTIDQRYYDGVEPWNRTSSHLEIGDEIRDAGILSSRDSLMGGSSLSLPMGVMS